MTGDVTLSRVYDKTLEVGDAALAYTYDGSLEGLLSAVFAAYANHADPQDVVCRELHQPRLGQAIADISTDEHLALRVQRGICKTCGPIVFEAIKTTSLSDDPRKGSVIYRFIRYAMTLNKPHDCTGCSRAMRCGGLCTKSHKRSALNDLSHPAVGPFQEMNRSVYNERHAIMQFLRFEHMEGDLWFAKCNPKASVVPLVMDWFSARFNTQPFLIYDEAHHVAGVYEGKEWYLVQTEGIDLPDRAEDEHLMQHAWKRFYDTIAVESRYNPELRRSFMPKRLWANITEMQEELPRTAKPARCGVAGGTLESGGVFNLGAPGTGGLICSQTAGA